MRKKRKWLIAVPVLLCCLAVAVYSMIYIWNDDHTPPVITLETERLEISVSDTEEVLLSGVRASDDQDGDVTAGIVVEGISNISSDHTATVTYAAFDRSGNVAKAVRTIYYTDYETPRFEQTEALVFQEGTPYDVLDCLKVQDIIDGDLSDKIKGTLISNTTSISYAGLHQVDFRVTNTMGETIHLILPVEVYESGTYNAAVELTDYLVYLEKGAEFNAGEYLTTLRINEVEYALQELSSDVMIDIDVESNVDTEIPGVYSVTYTVTMNRFTGYTRLNVVVEE